MKVQAPKSGQPYNPHSDSVKGSESVDRGATAHMERSLRFMSMVRMTKNAETASTLVMTSANISDPLHQITLMSPCATCCGGHVIAVCCRYQDK